MSTARQIIRGLDMITELRRRERYLYQRIQMGDTKRRLFETGSATDELWVVREKCEIEYHKLHYEIEKTPWRELNVIPQLERLDRVLNAGRHLAHPDVQHKIDAMVCPVIDLSGVTELEAVVLEAHDREIAAARWTVIQSVFPWGVDAIIESFIL